MFVLFLSISTLSIIASILLFFFILFYILFCFVCLSIFFRFIELCCVCFYLQRKPMLNKLKMYVLPRLKLQLRRQSQFNARKKFQYAILCVRAMVRIQRLRYTIEPLRMEDSLKDPYRVKVLRKVNDFNQQSISYVVRSVFLQFNLILFVICMFI